MKHNVFITYFGNIRYAPLLNRCIDQYLAAEMPKDQLFILTDTETFIPHYITSKVAQVVRMGTTHSNWLVRKGNPGESFDYKSVLITTLLHQNSCLPDARPLVVLDCDNIIKRSFEDIILMVPENKMVIAQDPGLRPIIHPAFPGEMIEQSSSCMVFPANSHEIVSTYFNLWNTSTEKDHVLLEQRTWTLVNEKMGGLLLPRNMSWSRLWSGDRSDVRIYHPHGQEKWNGIAQ